MSIIKVISYLCLLAVLLSPILFFADVLTQSQMNIALLGATVVWFATASTWINKEA
ncbi:hypothetical protein [Persicitalea jodogahamensis]|uniref:Uncharacterized protein n=1 Tax=Persicitalea jodogahamensis TaxID=402147 RepID=A0A8J3D2U7_9BACT|nr:hypothetical protein [Persicitalea jodogahamensis]GHB72218.1 hypothetical protein GCM10007390_27840 [Persicitalea jodogahamensis]